MSAAFTRARRATREPSVRARYMQTFATHVDRLPAEDRSAIRAVIPEDTWAAIDAAGLLGWLPISVNLACTRAVSKRLGPQRTHEFFRTLLLGTAETPLLRGLVQGVLRVAVRDPGLYLPWISKGFELMFRDAGRWTVGDRGEGFAVTEVRDLPVECVSDDLWIQSVASSLCALLDLTRLKGTVVVREVDTKARRVEYAWRALPR